MRCLSFPYSPKVIAYLLTELDKKKSPGRLICSILQRLSWVAVYTRAQRAEVYNAHFLCGMIQCIQSQDDSIQQAIQRYFPVIFDYFGPFISASHTERATELFNATMKNLSSGGVKNRAASTVISCLAKFVPSILHKSFYQLSDIILQGGDDDEQHQHEIAGALNTLSVILPFVLENMNQNLAFMLKKLLCRVLCCLYSRGNEVVLASLEFLQKFVSKHQQFRDSIQQLAQFDPLFVQMLGPEERSTLKSNIYCVDEQKPSCSKSFEDELEKVETMSCFSMRTGYSLSRPASAWNSLQDLLAEQKMLGLNLDEQTSDIVEKSVSTVDDTEENYQKIDENILENDDNVSVSSAELFVDPLMNCLHQQQKSIGNSAWSLSQKSKNLRSNDGTLSMRTRTNTTSGLLTPISIISRSVGQKSLEDQQYTSSAVSSEENQGILEFLPDNFCNTGVNFWIYSSLFVAKRFLLAGKGRIRSNREIRVSQKIIALNYISDSLLMESSVIHQPIFDCTDGQHYSLFDLHLYISNDDDNLAIASLNFFFNVEKCCFFNDPLQFDKLFVEKSKLIWYLKKTLHCQRNSNRLKGIFQIFINSIHFLCSTEGLLLASCDYAISADAVMDYFRVKAVRAEFISKIKWSYTSPQIRQKLLNEFCRVFLVQLFDKDPRVQKATLDALPLFVLNLDLSISTYLINQNSTLNSTSTLLQLWNSCQKNNENTQQPLKSKPSNTNCIERCLLLYLRTLNLFYSIVAEEKVRRHKLLLHRTGLIAEGFVSNAAFLLSNPSSLILPEKSDYFSTTAKSLLNTTSPNAKAINLSFLLGSSTSHGRRQLTSYSNSIVLTSLEMHLRNSYKSFLESLKPDLHSRFLDLFNSTMDGFCTFLEFADFSLIRSFIDELVIFLQEMAGWMHSNRMKLPLVTIVDETQQEQMNRLLHQFEPFLSHLLKLYPLTNSNRTRKSILECIFILCLCNVRYELLDANGRFKSKIISQLKQLSPEEDAPILPSMCIFVLLVVRVRCLKFSEIGLVIEQLFSRMDHKTCYCSLEAFKIIIFDILSQFSRKSRISEDHKRILIQLKDGLLKIFSITFQLFPETSAEVWICLLHAFRDHFDSESLSIMSLDFITHYLKFYEKMAVSGGEFATPQNSPTRETTPQIDANEQYSFLNGHSSIKSNLLPNPTRQLFLHSALISQCIVSTEL
uniref:HEAT repeat-containing protein 1 n=1 Tax=Meloidogyne javanica TaxID=6303 RepID=A0A915LG95_MELJA